MGDLKVNEAFTDAVKITTIGSNVGVDGLTPTCYSVKISDNTRTLLTVTGIGNGWYKADFTNDAAGTWVTEWAVTGNYTINYPYKMFKSGGGEVADLATTLTAIEGTGFTTGTDSLKIVSDNIDTIGTRLTALRAGYIDNLSAGAVAQAGTALSNATWTDAKAGYLTGAVALEASLTAMKGAGWSTETLKVIKDAISALNNITAASVWAVGTRELTDKANFTLASGEYDNIRKSVCATGDTANSMGKILYDFYNTRLGATRCGYIDNLSAGAAALEATLTAIKGAGWSAETLKNIHDDAVTAKNVIDNIHDTDLPAVKTDTAAIKTMTDKIGTVTNTGGTASIGAIIGDPANSSLVTLLTAINTNLTFLGQTDISDSANTAQNVSSTVLATTLNCRIENLAFKLDTATEDLVLTVDADGQTYTCTQAGATSGTWYYPVLGSAYNTLTPQTTDPSTLGRSFLMERRSVAITIKKTSANNGAVTIYWRVKYSKR